LRFCLQLLAIKRFKVLLEIILKCFENISEVLWKHFSPIYLRSHADEDSKIYTYRMIGSNNLEKGMSIRSACEHFSDLFFYVFFISFFCLPTLVFLTFKLREFVHRLTRENIPTLLQKYGSVLPFSRLSWYCNRYELREISVFPGAGKY
jgi:hypothetical protein